MKFYYVYVLKSRKDKKNYVGYTENLKLRFEQHNKGQVESTKSRRPFVVVYYEACLSRKDATHREKYLKTRYGKMFIKNRLKSYLTGKRKSPGDFTLCPQCWESVALWNGLRCETCGVPVPTPAETCSNCLPALAENDPRVRLRTATYYADAVRQAIHALKYAGRPRLVLRLADLVLRATPPLYAWDDYAGLIPIPLYRVRQVERGYNQAERLARVVGGSVGLTVETRWLRRARPTRPLAGLGGDARREELRGVFRACLPTHARGAALLLVDDIVTTGATAFEAARTLLDAGANHVDVLAVARAGRRPDGSYADADNADADNAALV